MKEYKDLTPAEKKIVYDLACEFGFGHYSTIEEIDYKFWEDIPAQWIAFALAKELASVKYELKELKSRPKDWRDE